MKKRVKKINFIALSVLFIFLVLLVSLLVNFTGKIVFNNTDLSAKCSDSDSGNNIYVRGIAKSSSRTTQNDFCVSGAKLREFYCYGNGIGSVLVNCLDGCSEGACKKTDKICVDSDNGADLTVRGTTTNLTVSKVDSCYDGNTVYESECSGENVLIKQMACGSGKICVAGSCITK